MFGGASQFEARASRASIGEQNVAVARCFLREEAGSRSSRRAGGTRGRKILFSSRPGTFGENAVTRTIRPTSTSHREALLGVFLAEAEERLIQMEEGLVALEEHPNEEELLEGIFRAAHTLKGNSATLGFAALTEFTHVLEDLLERVRKRRLVATPALVTLLLESVDALRRLLADAAGGLDEIGPPSARSSRASRRPGRGHARRTRGRRLRTSAEAGGGPRGEMRTRVATRTLRVDVESLDQMLDLVGEIAVSRGRLRQLLDHSGALETEKALEVHREADRLRRSSRSS